MLVVCAAVVAAFLSVVEGGGDAGAWHASAPLGLLR
jgi:hypothetical protein